jgi:hypothetical protein
MKTLYTLALAIFITITTGCKNDESLGITDTGSSGEQTNALNDEAAPTEIQEYKSSGGTFTIETANAATTSKVQSYASDKTVTRTNQNGTGEPESAPQAAPKITAKKLIKIGTLNMEVEDYKAARKKINSYIPQYKAYIGGENETNNGSQVDGTITIRVPFDQFDGLLEAIAGEGEYIANKTVKVEDVTAEYVDLGARLKTKLEVEDRYRDILKKAGKIPDILSVENELRVIREEIEAAQGRMKYINDQTAYSTLTVQMYQTLPYQVTPQPGFFGKLAESLVSGWRGLLGFIVGIASVWPFLVFITVAIIFGRKFLKAKKLV